MMTKTRAMLDRELADINERILRVGSLVDSAIERSMRHWPNATWTWRAR